MCSGEIRKNFVSRKSELLQRRYYNFNTVMFIGRPTARHMRTFSTYKRKGTTPNLLIPKKVGSKSARCERVYKRAAETRRDFFRRGGERQAGGCHAFPRGTEQSGLCSDEVCVPYRRKPIRLNRRVGAPAPTAERYT